MENYSLLMGAAALMKMAVKMAAVSMEKPSPSRRRAGTETPVPDLGPRWRRSEGLERGSTAEARRLRRRDPTLLATAVEGRRLTWASARLGVGGDQSGRGRRGERGSWERLRWSESSSPSGYCRGELRLNWDGSSDNVDEEVVEESERKEGSRMV
ncbi:hypothetical protein QYE76_030618 [Lolium multiflorum]|uniref:Uncharacterized protein n=1 Tax=Lolium multiflorum TaxID=4521 RepID=A0AAD8QQ57_LOLMU|nr:hypothetical protein QYE76_030618 [Lolium multiflorum]